MEELRGRASRTCYQGSIMDSIKASLRCPFNSARPGYIGAAARIPSMPAIVLGGSCSGASRSGRPRLYLTDNFSDTPALPRLLGPAPCIRDSPRYPKSRENNGLRSPPPRRGTSCVDTTCQHSIRGCVAGAKKAWRLTNNMKTESSVHTACEGARALFPAPTHRIAARNVRNVQLRTARVRHPLP